RAARPRRNSERYSKARMNSSRVRTRAGCTGHGPRRQEPPGVDALSHWNQLRNFHAARPRTISNTTVKKTAKIVLPPSSPPGADGALAEWFASQLGPFIAGSLPPSG